MDTGFINLEQIGEMERCGVEVYAPPKAGKGGMAPKVKDPPEIAGWRARMATEEGKRVYKDRHSTAEWVNAQIRERHGVRQFNVRGLARVTSIMLLVVITHPPKADWLDGPYPASGLRLEETGRLPGEVEDPIVARRNLTELSLAPFEPRRKPNSRPLRPRT